jgi:hypothetical protein
VRRREFITLIGGAATAWPLATSAQHAAMPVIGFLDPRKPEAITDRLGGFRQGLKEAGFVEGENLLPTRSSSDLPKRRRGRFVRSCRISALNREKSEQPQLGAD